MRIVISDCSVVYTGRGDTTLKRAVRAILIKSDGAISIHNDVGNKPLNYMGKDNVFTESIDDDGVILWTFDTRKDHLFNESIDDNGNIVLNFKTRKVNEREQESLTVKMHEVISDTEHLLDDKEKLVKDGTEKHLQEWIAANPECLGEGWSFVQREFETGDGPVDLLVRDDSGNYVAVEVKRTAMLSSVDQLGRYVTAIKESYADRQEKVHAPPLKFSKVQLGNMADDIDNPESYLFDPLLENVRGIIAALDVRPKTALLAEKRGVQYVILDKSWRDVTENNKQEKEES